MDTKENYNKMVMYLDKVKKDTLNKLSDFDKVQENKIETLELFSIREVSKYEIICRFAKCEDLTQILGFCEVVLWKTEYKYYRVDKNGNISAIFLDNVNYIHKEFEFVKLAETLKIMRLCKDYLFIGNQKTLF